MCDERGRSAGGEQRAGDGRGNAAGEEYNVWNAEKIPHEMCEFL